mgnify:CR=1 FL=1
MSTILFFHAHPDDEASQTSGAMARAVSEGHRVVVVYATNGDHGDAPDDLAPGGQIVFSATGITYGELLSGVRRFAGGARTHTLVMGYATRVVRFIDSIHLEEEHARVTIRV